MVKKEKIHGNSTKKVLFDDATKAVFKNKIFVNHLLSLETGEQVRAALADKGIVLTASELDKFAEILVLALEKGDSMTDDELKQVVGGVGTNKNSLEYALADSIIYSGLDIRIPPGSFFNRTKDLIRPENQQS